jgi:hypothetical protein
VPRILQASQGCAETKTQEGELRFSVWINLSSSKLKVLQTISRFNITSLRGLLIEPNTGSDYGQ